MENLLALWQSWNWTRRGIVVGATLAVFLSVMGLARIASTPGMALLYSGLEPAQAGDVVRSLEAAGVAHEIRGGAVYVDQSQRDTLRLTLAADGLPGNNGAGYELLENLTGFGTTSKMFDAAYWRAKEGELARTIMASPLIRHARVHIAEAPDQPFQASGIPKASVSVETRSGELTTPQARAIRHLVAAAVPRMVPSEVALIDTVTGLITTDLEETEPSGRMQHRAAEIRSNIERLLTARVGEGNAIVEVIVDIVTEDESIKERRIDPQERVAISTETVTNSGTETSPGGAVTVASNLPSTGEGGAGDGKSERNENSERVNYEVSETEREILRPAGSIRKISVAVLVNGQTITAEDGTTTWQNRSEEELAILSELVRSAAGMDAERGDVLTLKSMEFTPSLVPTDLGSASILPQFGPIDLMGLLQIAVLAIVTLVIGLFVLRPVLMRSAPPTALSDPLSLPSPGHVSGYAGVMAPEDAATAMMLNDQGSPLLMGRQANGQPLAIAADQETFADPMTRLRQLISERQTESVEVLRNWIDAKEEQV